MKIAAVIQARMSSRRLPGKVLTPIGEKPVLQFLLERLRRSKMIKTIIIATSTDSTDDAIVHFAEAQGIDCFRGSLKNVADRFRAVSARYELDAFVRVNADSPLLDPALIDQGVRLFLKHIPDVVTNVQERTFPKGQSVEVVSVPAFTRILGLMNAPQHFEHVTAYFYEHPEDYRIHNFVADGNFSDVRNVVDTETDLLALEEVTARMDKPQWEYGWKDLLQLYKEATSWLRTLQG